MYSPLPASRFQVRRDTKQPLCLRILWRFEHDWKIQPSCFDAKVAKRMTRFADVELKVRLTFSARIEGVAQTVTEKI